MAAAASSYNPKNVTLNIGGVSVTNFSDGDYITATPEADLYNNTVGANGATVRVSNLNRNWTMTVSLLQSALENSAFTGFVALGQKLDFARDIFKLALIDGNGDTALVAPQAYFQRWPDVVYGTEATAREWTIYLVNPTVVVAGLPLDNLIG